MTEKVEKVAYRLLLPASALIHDVFHVSLLKKCEGNALLLSGDLSFSWETEPKKPEKILDRRMVKRNNRAVSQLLIQWKGRDRIETTWEDAKAIPEKFSSFTLAD